ncbi:hypothetical protein V5O48_004659 [Marasmius crinis-equi]|uniref:RlpA-like protein double-psi beta-barrel domain-containing protein n=1 Tax=Marasmius crinis-equi TaxID=585013 RepID=A0ABR3FPZ8_9AGAR
MGAAWATPNPSPLPLADSSRLHLLFPLDSYIRVAMFRFATFLFFVAFLYTVLAAPVSPGSSSEESLTRRGQFWGRATWFNVGLGNCGWTNNDGDWIVALSLGSTYENGNHCGKQVRVTANGVTKQATVADSCPGCGNGDLDMSPSFFQQFASLDQGVFNIDWDFV